MPLPTGYYTPKPIVTPENFKPTTTGKLYPPKPIVTPENFKPILTPKIVAPEPLDEEVKSPVIEERKADYAPVKDTSEIRRDIAEADKTPEEVKGFQTFEEFKTGLVPTEKAPEVPTYEDKYKTLRASQGISAIEDDITEYELDAAEAEAELAKFKTSEKYGAGTQGMYQGRLTEEQQIIQDRVNTIANLQKVAIKKLEFKNDYIKNIMGFTKEDYTTALDNYEKEFNKNISLQNSFSTEKNRVRDDARATITTVVNGITNSTTGKTIDDLPLASQEKLKEQCLIAGIDYDALKAVTTAKPKANMVGNGTGYDEDGNQFFWSATMDSPDATAPTINRVYTGGMQTSLVDDEKKALAIRRADTFFSSLEGPAPLDLYRGIRTDWVAAGGSATEFDKTFGSYLSKEDQSKINVATITTTSTKGPRDFASLLKNTSTK